MCRNSLFETRVSCFWLAYPLWNGTHYRKLPTRGFNKELLCEQEGPGYWGWAKNVGFLALGPLTCLLHWLVQQVVRWSQGISGHKSLEWRLSSYSEHWSGVVCPKHGTCGAPLLLYELGINKIKGLHFVWDDIECCKGGKPVFCSCRSETLLQLYT